MKWNELKIKNFRGKKILFIRLKESVVYSFRDKCSNIALWSLGDTRRDEEFIFGR